MIRVFEAFSGIGTQRMALRNLGIEHEVVATSEIDKFAIKSYEAIHGKTYNLGDISEISVDDIPDHDLFTYSFPCQDISLAGKQGGLSEGSGTRSSLLWECKRVIEHKRPKYLLLENVKNLVGKKHKEDFDSWLSYLNDLGYTNYWEVLNAKDFGVPQNRERVFVVSILGEHEEYKFPEKQVLEIRLKDVLEDEVDEKFYLDNDKAKKLVEKISEKYDVQDREVVDSTLNDPKVKNVMNTVTSRYDAGIQNYKSIGGAVVERIGGIFDTEKSTHQAGAIFDKEQLAPTLDTMQGGWRQPSIVEEKKSHGVKMNRHEVKGEVDVASTLLARDYKGFGNQDGTGVIETNSPKIIDDIYNNRPERVYEEYSPSLRAERTGLKVAEPLDGNYYCKDNVVITEHELLTKYDGELPFDPDYIYVEPTVIKYNDSIVLINSEQTQLEVIRIKDGFLETDFVITDIEVIEDLLTSTPKEEFGRMGKQAVETFEKLKLEHGETLNPFYRKQSSKDGISPTLTTRPEGFKTAISVSDKFRIRKLTPLECWRLMGTTDEDFYKAQEVNSNTQLYKQAGNAIVVDVLENIFVNLFKTPSTRGV